jgi:hypothetical protein
MIKKSIKKNRVCLAKQKQSSGFVLLFAVTLSAILLSIALGVSNITFRELRFSTNARDTNDAFFAADTGLECAEFYDKSTSHIFEEGGGTSIKCIGNHDITVTRGFEGDSNAFFWSFTLSGLNSGGQGCANVTVDKRWVTDGYHTYTVVTSDGYNNGDSTCTPTSNRVEREIKSEYGFQ